jgi:LysM repeat protein
MDAIIQANNLTDPSHIYAGQQLVIPNFDSTPTVVQNPTVAGTPVYHTIVYGDTLDSIAKQYGMTTDQLMQINNITNPNLIYRGQQLIVWAITNVEPSDSNTAAVNVTEALTADTTAPAADTQTVSNTTYVVQPGEQLAQIARRFNVSWPAIAQANSLTDPNQIFAGQTLIIPAAGTIADLGILSAPAAPTTPDFAPYPPTIFVGKQVVVDLTHQMVYAYQDGALIYSVLASTGLPGSPTVTGDYNVYVKYAAQTMVGPGYYLPDVPYVMYFYEGYGLHGTYWHNNFGHPMSHGCVNLPTPDAEWFFDNFVEVGTPIHIQY